MTKQYSVHALNDQEECIETWILHDEELAIAKMKEVVDSGFAPAAEVGYDGETIAATCAED